LRRSRRSSGSRRRSSPFQLDQVERIQEHAAIVALIPDALEQRDAILAARDCLTIEDARAGASREGPRR